LNIKDIISSGLLELYATGLASQEEAAQAELWIQQYPEVAAEFKKISSINKALIMADRFELDANVRNELFTKIDSLERTAIIPLKTNTTKTTTISHWWKWGVAASVLLLIGSIWLNISLYKNNNDMKLALGIKPITLHAMMPAVNATAKVFWLKNTGDVYVDISALPEIPPGKQYQFWAIVNGKCIDGGMIQTSNPGDKQRIQKMKQFNNAESFDITIEKTGGSILPTKNQMIVMGKT
jgi:anti-sigma-K factor RskA